MDEDIPATKGDAKKSEKHVKIMFIILGIFFVMLIIAILSILKSGGTHSYSSGGQEYEIVPMKVGTGISYKIKIFINEDPQPYYINARYEPKQVEKLDISPDVSSILAGKKDVYFTIDPNDQNLTGKTTIAALEMSGIINNPALFSIPTHSSFTSELKNNIVKTCADANSTDAVILLELGESTKAYRKGDCLIIQGSDEEGLIQLADGIAFRILGIIKN